jgi:hypothetical protein
MSKRRLDKAFACSRRNVWPALLQELRVWYDSIQGQPGGRLAALRDLDDEQLAKIRPMLNPDYEILVEQDVVCCRAKGVTETRPLFRMKQENLTTFNQFIGQRTLAEIGAQLAQQMGWEQAEGFCYARDLFLDLVDRLVCVPRDPPELPGWVDE